MAYDWINRSVKQSNSRLAAPLSSISLNSCLTLTAHPIWVIEKPQPHKIEKTT